MKSVSKNKKRCGSRLYGKRLSVAALLATTSAAVLMVATPVRVYAQSSQLIRFNISSGALSSALAEFGRQSGIQVSYPPEYAAGKQTTGVSGQATPDQALAQLLQGSGLTYSFTSTGTVTISDRVSAAVAPVEDDGSLMLDTIRVTSKVGVNPADAPYQTAGSSAYISGEQIERFRGTSVGDFISGVPGVMNGDSRNSGAVDVNIRGMQGQGRVPVIVDGASNETTVYRGYNGSNSRTYIDPDFIGSVSIEKGPSMGVDATGATGGVVRMSTIGVDDILLPGKSFGIRLKGGFNTNSSSVPAVKTERGWRAGSYPYNGTMPSTDTLFAPGGMDRPSLFEPTGGSGSVALAGTTEYFDVVAAYARRKNGNYYAGKHGGDGAHPVLVKNNYGRDVVENGGLSPFRAGEEVLNTSLDNESWLLKTKIKFDEGHSLELGWNRYQSVYGDILPTQITSTGVPYQNTLSEITLNNYTARYKWNPEDNDLIDLKVDAFRADVDLRVNSAIRYSYPSLGIDILSPSLVYAKSERWGITAANASHFYTGIGDFKLEYGGAFTREDIGLPSGVSPDTEGLWMPRDGWRKESSGFTSLEWKPIDWLTLNGGLRYSHFKTWDDTDGSTSSAGGWSPVASLTIEPIQGLQFYGKYGSVLRSPSIFETLKTTAFDAGTQNPVDPERAKSIEFGVNHIQEDVFRDGDKIRLHAAYFNNHIDNYITRANVLYTRENGSTGYRLNRINLDNAEMRGFELSASYDTGKYFGDLAWNHYTHMMFCAPDGITLSPGNSQCAAGGIRNSYGLLHVPPKDTLTLNLGARLLDEKLTVGSRLTYVSSRFADGVGDGSTLGTGEINASRWSPYTLVDLYASYKINENATFDFAIDNVTDRYYMDALNASLMPAPGRTIRGSLTVKF